MKWLTILMACAGIMSLGFLSKKRLEAAAPFYVLKKGGNYSPVAVVELFTSEGCSSCPPADMLLPRFADNDSSVIPLSFHVDYWNYLGWRDPFSRSEYSARQRNYVQQFQLESAYTPQLVVNGQYELVGSDRHRAADAIRKSLAEPAVVAIFPQFVRQSGHTLQYMIRAEGNLDKTVIRVALVQKKAIMKIKAGENKGATLMHQNIVRSLNSYPAGKQIQGTQQLPQDIGAGNWILVFFAQRMRDLTITGAAVFHPE